MKNVEIFDILLVEDNPNDAELTLRAIRKRNFANPIHVVTDGAEALDFMFCRNKYSNRIQVKLPKLILLDLRLPKLSGLEVLKVLKSDEKTCGIPVVVVTSSREDPDIKAAYKLGANSYVVKPVEFEAFFETMNNIGFYWLFVNETN